MNCKYIKFFISTKFTFKILLSDSKNLCFNNLTQACHDKILNALQKKENNSFGSADNSFRDSYSTLTVIGSNWDVSIYSKNNLKMQI